MDTIQRFNTLKRTRASLEHKVLIKEAEHKSSLEYLEKVVNEQRLLENSLLALKEVKPILSANSIEQCEKLANSALESIFGTTAKLKYDADSGRFMIEEEEGDTDLREGNGGGYLSVISLIFDLFLLVKMKKRLFLCFDESFTQISDKYFNEFFEFLRALHQDLGLDLLLITHDLRIKDDMVDHIYVMDDGIAHKIK